MSKTGKEKGQTEIMKNERRNMCGGLTLLLGFVLWTILIQMVDVKSEGIDGTDIGFSTINVWFHNLTGVHMKIYTITDWLGLVAVFVCIGFGLLGLCQWIKRRKLLNVDFDIRMLGVFYVRKWHLKYAICGGKTNE